MVSDSLKISVYSGNPPPRLKKRRSLFSVATKILDLITKLDFENIPGITIKKNSMFQFMTYFS